MSFILIVPVDEFFKHIYLKWKWSCFFTLSINPYSFASCGSKYLGLFISFSTSSIDLPVDVDNISSWLWMIRIVGQNSLNSSTIWDFVFLVSLRWISNSEACRFNNKSDRHTYHNYNHACPRNEFIGCLIIMLADGSAAMWPCDKCINERLENFI